MVINLTAVNVYAQDFYLDGLSKTYDKHPVSIKRTAYQKDGSVCVFFKLMGSDERWVYLQVRLYEYIKM